MKSRDIVREPRHHSEDFSIFLRGERNLFPFEPLNVVLVPFRSDKLVMTAAHEFEQIVEKLADVGGTDEMLETKFANATSQVNPEIFLIQNAEVFVNPLEEIEAIVMECPGLDDSSAKQFPDTLAHLVGRVNGVGESENLVRVGVPFANEVLDAVS